MKPKVGYLKITKSTYLYLYWQNKKNTKTKIRNESGDIITYLNEI